MKCIKKILFTAVLLMGGVSALASNFADTYGFSAQGIALGNAMTARVNDWSSVYYNIAGLGRTLPPEKKSVPAVQEKEKEKEKGKGDKKNSKEDPKKKSKKNEVIPASSAEQHFYVNDLAITYFRTIPQLDITIKRTDEEGNDLSTDGADIDSYGFTIVGLAVDLNLIYRMPKIISSARFGIGMALNDDLSAVKLNDVDLRTHNFVRYGREAQKAVVIAGAGLGFLNDMVGFGVGANISFCGEGTVLLENVNMESGTQVPDGQSKMDLSLSPSLVAGMYISPGRLFPIVEGLDLGVSYRQESYMEIYPFKTAALAMDNAVVMQMVVAILDYYSPHIITWGAAYTRWGVTVSADMEYHMWSRYKVNVANNEHYSDLPEFRDILVYRLGVEWQWMSWLSLMCGTYYQPSFVTDSASGGVFNFLDNDRYTGSAGVKTGLPRMFGFGGPVEITAAYQLQYLAEKSVTKEDPTTFNPDYKYGGTSHSLLIGIVLKL